MFVIIFILISTVNARANDEVQGWCFFFSPSQCSCKYTNDLKLNCSARNLTQIPELIEESKWQLIDLKQNRLGKLNQYEFTNILVKEIDLSSCDLQYIHKNAFALSKGIEKLSLAHNSLTTISSEMGKHLNRLKWLDLSYNPLNDVNFAQFFQFANYHMEAINLDGVKTLREINLEKLTNLKNVSMSNMALTHLPNSKQSKIYLPLTIIMLQLSHNNISMIETKEMTTFKNVTHLNLSYNMFTAFPLTLQSENLSILDLGHNMIKYIPGWIFKAIPNVEHFVLANNGIENISDTFLCKVGPNVSFINLENNRINEFPLCSLRNNSKYAPTIMLNNNNVSCLCLNSNFTISSWNIVIDKCWEADDIVFNKIWSSNCNHSKAMNCQAICLEDDKDDDFFHISYEIGRPKSSANKIRQPLIITGLVSLIVTLFLFCV